MDSTAMQRLELTAVACPICHTHDNARELYPAKLTHAAFNPETFSARRLPDRVHYRVVRCNSCGLVRTDTVAKPATQAELYRKSTFDYGAQVENLRITYGRYLAKLPKPGALLEIGCGNGFMLQEALEQGYTSVTGVEPSADAVARADPSIRGKIVCDIMRPGLFAPNSFDAIAMFQTFDHIPDPNALLDECISVLKPGGVLLCVHHNVEAASAKLLGERSPIIDVEHPFLYSPPTMTRIASDHGFPVVEVFRACGGFAARPSPDVGCGDGFYSTRFWDAAKPKSWVGVDPAERAIRVANATSQARPLRFEVGDAHPLAYPADSFDLVLVQSI